jgi:Zn-finger nucleic acid-binding protein
MNCPRCETAPLDERDREGVTIDVCKSCRGLWLDRGELEKLIARTKGEIEQLERSATEYSRAPRSERDSSPDYDDYRRRHPRKRSWMESLGDIFD